MAWLILVSTWLFFIGTTIGLYILFNSGFVIVVDTSVEASSLLITAASFVLTGVAAIVAILALYGFGDIKRAALEAARIEAGKVGGAEASKVAYEIVPSVVMQAMESVSKTPTEVAVGIANASEDGNHG